MDGDKLRALRELGGVQGLVRVVDPPLLRPFICYTHPKKQKMSQSLSDDTLRKIQQAAVNANRNLTLTKAQLSSKERERRIVQLTLNEVSALGGSAGGEEDVKLYKGLGKMFVQVPKAEMVKSLKKQEKDLSDEVDGLTKKVRNVVPVLERGYLSSSTVVFVDEIPGKRVQRGSEPVEGHCTHRSVASPLLLLSHCYRSSKVLLDKEIFFLRQ
ncbi:hypothetical protein FRC17_002383 [Serendipita sp. 399]|nr:hypothetical protein FRC17_002383 [Serendipita sp. 399]